MAHAAHGAGVAEETGQGGLGLDDRVTTSRMGPRDCGSALLEIADEVAQVFFRMVTSSTVGQHDAPFDQRSYLCRRITSPRRCLPGELGAKLKNPRFRYLAAPQASLRPSPPEKCVRSAVGGCALDSRTRLLPGGRIPLLRKSVLHRFYREFFLAHGFHGTNRRVGGLDGG